MKMAFLCRPEMKKKSLLVFLGKKSSNSQGNKPAIKKIKRDDKLK